VAGVAGPDPGTPEGARASRRLAEDPVIWLTTVGADGTPMSSPVWFWWDGSSFLVYSRPGMAKVRNVEARPRVGLHLVGDALGDEVAVFEGDAAVEPSAPPADEHEGYAGKYSRLIARLGMTPAAFARTYSVPLRITPTRARVW
jgi:PPOX class probable F420-dependent enzyme